MNEQKRFFASMGKQLFDHIESAIEFADLHHPDEFLERSRQIDQLLLDARLQQLRGVNILDHDVSEEDTTATDSSEKLRALKKEKGKEKVKESETTKCHAEVKLPVPHPVSNKSCRVGSEEVNITKAAEVGMVTEKFSEKSSKRKITEKMGLMIKDEKSLCSDIEVKIEATKRRLKEAYKQCAKKKTRMIELKDIPRDVGCRPVNRGRSNKGRPRNHS